MAALCDCVCSEGVLNFRGENELLENIEILKFLSFFTNLHKLLLLMKNLENFHEQVNDR